ncbi:uncharacterized protein LOC134398114 [Elgaria multicarinata webbii]|uniref:uncharacterized protein LOC134398114 n=1 Tax=Elgaria multicarinata webbii TaxID=159646 RepID=UPI002FCCD4ED
MCSNECDSNQFKVIKSKRTCSKYSTDPLPQTLDGRGMIYLSDKTAVLHRSGDTSLPDPSWEYRSLETDSGSFHACHMPASKPLASTEHTSSTYNTFLSLRKYCNKMLHIYEQIPNQQLDESTTNASQSYSLESHLGTKYSYGLGHVFSKFCSIYSDTSRHVFQSSWFSKLVSLCDENEKYSQAVSCIKSFPFVKKNAVKSVFRYEGE